MGGIKICITVDWEGEDLSYVDDLRRLRDKLGHDLPFTHFICPNYFAGKTDTLSIAERIRYAIFADDEIALHVHCYKEMITGEFGIPFRTEMNYHNQPNWLQKNMLSQLSKRFLPQVTGRGVPLSVYSAKEIDTIIRESKKLLCDAMHLNGVLGFRAGGWIANDSVLNMLYRNGFRYDSSAVPPSLLSHGYTNQNNGNLKDDYGDKNGVFTDHILKLWGYQEQKSGFLKNLNIKKNLGGNAIEVGHQPFYIDPLLEIPNNCALTDFCHPEKSVIPLIQNFRNAIEAHPEQDFVLVYGCHQEGDRYYKALLVDFVDGLRALGLDDIEFVCMKNILSLY